MTESHSRKIFRSGIVPAKFLTPILPRLLGRESGLAIMKDSHVILCL